MKQRKYLYSLISLLAVGLILAWGYSSYISTTVIGTLNFPDFTVKKFIRSNDNSFVKIEPIELDALGDLTKYDMILVRIHGSSLTKRHLSAIKEAIKEGVAVFSTEENNATINSLKGRTLNYVATLMDNGSVKNYRSLFNFIRKKIDKKLFFNGSYAEPVIIPNDYFFYLGEDQFFDSFEHYQKFYKESGHYKENAPRVALLSGNINIQNSNKEHIAAIINSLEKKGLNVYPINSFGMKKLKMIAAVSPNLIINRPHGRLVMGGGESGTQLLKQLNVPILAPVTVSESYDKWLKSKQGMASGGMSSMSVVMPELDGAIAPFAVAAQFERDGLNLFDAIPQHTEKFCRLANNFVRLQTKENREKKVAIYYFKGTGKGAVSAADIEGVQSLYNTLLSLKSHGYKVEGLPQNAKDLERMIQQSGSVLGPYALGAYDKFLKEGNPALVNVDTFKSWSQKELPLELIKAMEERYGEAPGDYMSVNKANKKYIAVARLQFGNVAILPQPMPSVGKDVNKLIHGTKGAPAYPYVASYLWTRRAFNADAIVHFGTHGSLEFIPGKQIALSDYDWSDVLIGDKPHFYIYTINNIGEGIIAKRRTYATLISHLTAPFMQGEVYGELDQMKVAMDKYEALQSGALKEGYLSTITKLAKRQNILSALAIDSTKTLSEKDLERIHIYLEEIDEAKVIDGLYTLGVPYSSENVNNSVRLMVIDAIRYALATVDVATNKIEASQLDNLVFISKHYSAKAERIISQALSGTNSDVLFRKAVGEGYYAMLNTLHNQKAQRKVQMMKRMRQAMAQRKPQKRAKFFDKEMNLIELPPKKKPAKAGLSAMDKMAQAKPVTLGGEEDKKQQLVAALMELKETISRIYSAKSDLAQSTSLEQDALADALNGGYVEPGSAGDPIVNPNAVPTGKNFYAINPETTPTAHAWKVGKRLAENLLEAELEANGKYPEKVSFSLWATNFISTEGATMAQILYLLGVEPLRDGFGYIRSLQLIPAEKLNRPRIDVVVQTSGQLRDIAASRLKLIHQAIALAAQDKCDNNYVSKGFADAERRLLEKGFSPVEARKYSRERIFGGAGGNYGTGIMGLVESGDKWEDQSQIAQQYISNMGALYSANGDDSWGEYKPGVFEAALLNTSVVVQPRSSNTWGPLSLDHVYEFMGGMSAAVKEVTGHDPTGYFNDFRNSSRAKVQGLKEAIGVETNSTVFNPKYIKEMLKGEASAMGHFAETFRNTYGWNAMKPSAIDQHIWNNYYDIYVNDKLKLGIKKTFKAKNPYALQEMTAVMLESARKGMWKASTAQIKRVAELHSDLLKEHSAGCSGFICDNAKLRQYITQHLSKEQAKQYSADIKAAREVKLDAQQQKDKVVLQKENQKRDEATRQRSSQQEEGRPTLLYISVALLLLIGVWLFIRKRSKH